MFHLKIWQTLRYGQGPKEMLSQQSYLKEINKTINLLLDSIEIVQQAT